MKRKIGILLFDNAEVLDFAGPFEVFSVTSEINNYEPFEVFTVAKSGKEISAVNGLKVSPKFNFENHPEINVFIIPGGFGTRALLNDAETLSWCRNMYEKSEITVSICTGAAVLAKLGLLKNKPYCTHQSVYDLIQQIESTAIPQKSKRFVKSDEKIYTSGGISAGIDLSFHVVETLLGKQTACDTAEYMEYVLNETI